MILYLAGSTSPKQLELIADKAGANNFLFTFADRTPQECAKYFCVQPQRHVFVDSGAFTAWTKGKKIKLGEYIAFCKHILEMKKCPVEFAALDVIPGTRDGGVLTEGELKRACEEGWSNYQTMLEEGIPCLMTYHQREHMRWLTRIADSSDYFAVAPRKSGVTNDQKFKWLKQIFGYINPLRSRKKVHGLGVSSGDWMEELPFFSVDNTQWQQGTRAHIRWRFVENRPAYKELEQWKPRAVTEGLPTRDIRFLRNLFGYNVPGENPDPSGNSGGTYWLMSEAMRAQVDLQDHVTDLWRSRGVVWEEQDAWARAWADLQAERRKTHGKLAKVQVDFEKDLLDSLITEQASARCRKKSR